MNVAAGPNPEWEASDDLDVSNGRNKAPESIRRKRKGTRKKNSQERREHRKEMRLRRSNTMSPGKLQSIAELHEDEDEVEGHTHKRKRKRKKRKKKRTKVEKRRTHNSGLNDIPEESTSAVLII